MIKYPNKFLNMKVLKTEEDLKSTNKNDGLNILNDVVYEL